LSQDNKENKTANNQQTKADTCNVNKNRYMKTTIVKRCSMMTTLHVFVKRTEQLSLALIKQEKEISKCQR
jgi:hypothetical protein